MQVVCEATQASEIQVKVAALQCLVKIMSLYYQFMEAYMGPALFAITLEAMKSEEDEVALQGIEFWSTVCDEEVDLQLEAAEAAEYGRPPESVSRFYAKGALQFIVPILMQTLTKQEEFDDEDDWNPCKAAGVCLMLLATCCEDDIVAHVLPFVKDNIKHTDWRYRDASLMAFGAVLEGPDPNNLKPIVEQAMPMLIELMHDPSVVVKDTAAWTIGRVCELHSEAAINEVYLKPLLEALVTGLSAEPRVAANVCWAFTSLAEAAYDAADDQQDESGPQTYCLSAYYEPIVQKLLETTDRPDAATANLRSAAYEALMEMVKNSPKDCYVTVQKTVMTILERLQSVLQMESRIQSQSDRTQFNDLQSLLCATLQVRRPVYLHLFDSNLFFFLSSERAAQGGGRTRAADIGHDHVRAAADVPVLREQQVWRRAGGRAHGGRHSRGGPRRRLHQVHGGLQAVPANRTEERGRVPGVPHGGWPRRRHLPSARRRREAPLRRDHDHPAGEPPEQRGKQDGQAADPVRVRRRRPSHRTGLPEVPRGCPPDTYAGVAGPGGQSKST